MPPSVSWSNSASVTSARRRAASSAAAPEDHRPWFDRWRERQQVIPFFDYDPDAFFPLLDDARILDPFEQLLGENFIFTVSEGIIHTGGSAWHHDAYAPEGLFSMRAAIYLDPLGPGVSQRDPRESLPGISR